VKKHETREMVPQRKMGREKRLRYQTYSPRKIPKAKDSDSVAVLVCWEQIRVPSCYYKKFVTTLSKGATFDLRNKESTL